MHGDPGQRSRWRRKIVIPTLVRYSAILIHLYHMHRFDSDAALRLEIV
jgi:hypothetical protein